MEVSRIENLPPPPGIINSIKAGFDAIASHVTAILMPLLLNLLLWLGPRLQMDTLFKSIEGDMVRFWQDCEDFFDNGLDELDDGKPKDKKKAEKKAEAEPIKCPTCRHVHKPMPFALLAAMSTRRRRLCSTFPER